MLVFSILGISDITGEQNVSSSETADSNSEALQNTNNNELLLNSSIHEEVTNKPQNIVGDDSPPHDSLTCDSPAHDNSDAEEIIRPKPKHNYISSQSEEDDIPAKSNLKKKYFKPNVLAKRKHRSSSFSAYSSCDEEANENSRRKKKKVSEC